MIHGMMSAHEASRHELLVPDKSYFSDLSPDTGPSTAVTGTSSDGFTHAQNVANELSMMGGDLEQERDLRMRESVAHETKVNHLDDMISQLQGLKDSKDDAL